ncbi:Ropporin-1-like protein [Vespula squamosa]|uniref:Ropporin-1-like protein n=1 Tax=Vespula squamosa TaxID=30214 RepID=A0ABD2BT48_VESSQ
MTAQNPLLNIYCPEQIHIPVTFPNILKVYAKAAIRTQPYDLLKWTAAYFRALANKEVPPVKERLEYPPFEHPSGITPGYLKTLLNRFGHVNKVPLRAILEHWQGIDLSETSLYQICLVGGFLKGDWNCDFYRFLAIACGLLADNLTDTMIYICELLTEDPEGGSAMIPLHNFTNLYGYLANLDCSGCICPMMIMKKEDEEIIEHEDLSFAPCTDVSLFEMYSWSDSTISYEPRSAVDLEERREEEEEKSILTSSVEDVKEESLVERNKDEIETIVEKTVEIKEERNVENKEETDTKNPTDDEKQDLERSDLQTTIPDKVETTIDDSVNEKEDVKVVEMVADKQKEEEEPEKIDRPQEVLHVEQEEQQDQQDLYPDIVDQIFDPEYIDFEGEWYPMDRMELIPSEEFDVISDICTCSKLEERIPTPPPPPADPVEEFIKRMEKQFEKDQLISLFKIDGIGPPISETIVTAVYVWLSECARRQKGYVGPRNIKHFLCPDLQNSIPCR